MTKKFIQKFITVIIATIFVVSLSSCAVIVQEKHDNGKHKGWYKNKPKTELKLKMKNNKKIK